MATPPIFPTLAGQGWSVHKRPTFSTRVASHVSGREVRSALYAATLYEFEVTFDALASAGGLPGLGATSLQTLLGFYLQCQGQLGTFLYVDPTDKTVTGQTVAIGDGTTSSFPLVRTLGAYAEPVSYVHAARRGLCRRGRRRPTRASSAPNTLTFTTAPGVGASITADFAYAFLCRFLDDSQDFENVMSGLWQLGSLKFRSVRT